jgi:hypothetical protein
MNRLCVEKNRALLARYTHNVQEHHARLNTNHPNSEIPMTLCLHFPASHHVSHIANPNNPTYPQRSPYPLSPLHPSTRGSFSQKQPPRPGRAPSLHTSNRHTPPGLYSPAASSSDPATQSLPVSACASAAQRLRARSLPPHPRPWIARWWRRRLAGVFRGNGVGGASLRQRRSRPQHRLGPRGSGRGCRGLHGSRAGPLQRPCEARIVTWWWWRRGVSLRCPSALLDRVDDVEDSRATGGILQYCSAAYKVISPELSLFLYSLMLLLLLFICFSAAFSSSCG